MDWKYKHFNQHAVFNAPVHRVLEAARQVLAESDEAIEEVPDGLLSRGWSGFHKTQATFRVSQADGGTELKVELLVQRYSALWGYVLWDPFGFYNSHIDKWFSEISERLGPSEAGALASKSTMSYLVQRGCLAGCLVWFAAVVCLGVAGTAADQALFPQFSGSNTPGPFTAIGSLVALAVGVVAFLYVRYPEGSVARFIKSHLPRARGGDTK